jgi:CRP/FNR family transcriptional regulator
MNVGSRIQPTSKQLSTAMPAGRKLLCDSCPGRSIGICTPLDDSRLTLLLGLGGTRHWKKGQTMFAAGDPAGTFYKVTKGIVAVYREFENGQRQIVGIHTIGDLCGYLQRDGNYTFSGEAITDVEACAFHRRRFDSFVVDHPDLANALATDMADKLTRVSENVAANSKLPAPERLAYFLLQLARIYETQMGAKPPLHLHLTRQQIAENLGLTIETVSRSFTKLKNDNLIALIGGDTVVILDPGKLARMATLGTG